MFNVDIDFSNWAKIKALDYSTLLAVQYLSNIPDIVKWNIFRKNVGTATLHPSSYSKVL